MIAPVASPQSVQFGPGVLLGASGELFAQSWLVVGGGLVGALVSTVSAPGLPQGVAPPGGPGGWLGIEAHARVEPMPQDAILSPFAELALGGGVTGERVAPSIAARFGFDLRIATWNIGAYLGYLRQFDLVPSVLRGDAQWVEGGVELSRTFVRPSAPRTPAPPPRVEEPRRCPEFAHTVAQDLDRDGCPDSDRDGDGIGDTLDHCVNEAEDRDGFEDQDGCPDPDNDHDNIEDTRDRCPNAAEVINGIDDEDGCPDESLARVHDGRVDYADSLRFFFNSVRLTRESRPVISAIALILRTHPEFAVIYVEGHADSLGDAHYNDRLSWLRARTVIDALVALGIERSRMRPYGYGQQTPITEGNDYWERALNRRVQFVLDGRRTPGRVFSRRGYEQVPVPEVRP
ncbi:MAG: OmpA family protein [Deltaproteobacteria bacterium]|nr:OmpA family protein [Deltaproteobacteria bacterium]